MSMGESQDPPNYRTKEIEGCYRLNVCRQIYIPNVMVLGDENLRRWLGHED